MWETPTCPGTASTGQGRRQRGFLHLVTACPARKERHRCEAKLSPAGTWMLVESQSPKGVEIHCNTSGTISFILFQQVFGMRNNGKKKKQAQQPTQTMMTGAGKERKKVLFTFWMES